jgi:hypothetical protein
MNPQQLQKELAHTSLSPSLAPALVSGHHLKEMVSPRSKNIYGCTKPSVILPRLKDLPYHNKKYTSESHFSTEGDAVRPESTTVIMSEDTIDTKENFDFEAIIHGLNEFERFVPQKTIVEALSTGGSGAVLGLALHSEPHCKHKNPREKKGNSLEVNDLGEERPRGIGDAATTTVMKTQETLDWDKAYAGGSATLLLPPGPISLLPKTFYMRRELREALQPRLRGTEEDEVTPSP